jgi:DNA-directed RNA polymerase subunit RPC12/RpoP
MSTYECPYCGELLSCGDVEDVSGFWGEEDSQEREFDCLRCRRPILVKIEVSASFAVEAVKTVEIDGEEVPDMSVDMAAVWAEFSKSPEQVRVSPDVACEICGQPVTDCGCTALDLIKSGYRVAQDFPGVRVTCPDCYGGEHHAAH